MRARIALAAGALLTVWWGQGLHAQSGGSFSTLTTTGPNTLGGTTTANGDALLCSGRPWIDVRCNGAVGDDTHDDTGAIQTTIDTAIANNWPLHLPAGTYRTTALLTIDYAGQAAKGFRLISEGGTIDGRAVAAGPVLQIQCGGGTPSSPAACFYFKEQGALFVEAATTGYAVVVGKTDFSDQHNSAKFDHLSVNNRSTAATAGACQFNALYDGDIWAVCVAAGGGAGMAFEQTQFSRVSGAGTAQGAGGRGIVLENGYDFSNSFFALDLEVSPTCLSITTPHNGLNTFLSPYFNCATAVNATASSGNILLNPNYGGAVVNYGPQSSGISVIGSGSRAKWLFPTVASYTPAPVDDGLNLSSYNAPGTSMTVSLPAVASLNQGWSMGFATDNGKGMTINAPPGAAILYQGKALPSVTLGAGNYELVLIQSDGSNYRLLGATRNTRLANGYEPPAWPTNWLYPSSPGYAAQLADDGNILSSYNTAAGLTVTLPPTPGLSSGWMMGFATDNGKPLTVQVNGSSGGHIVYPGSGGATNSVALATTSQGAYEYLALQYDGSGNFRVVETTPATSQALGTIGAASLSHWSFPATSAYAATLSDDGNVISSFNSPTSYMAVTLPPQTALTMGWTIGLASDSSKAMAVQVNATAGGKILFPGGGGSATSFSLAAGNYEFAALSFDGSNFRVIQATPATMAANAVTGATAPLPNLAYNPGMEIDQANEGASVPLTAGAAAYTVDGWVAQYQSAATSVACQRSADAPPGFAFSLKCMVGGGSGSVAATDFLAVYQPIEADDIADLAFGNAGAQPVCATVWLKSSTGGPLSLFVSNGTGAGLLGGTRWNAAGLAAAPAGWAKTSLCFPGDSGGSWATSGSGPGLRFGVAAAAGATYTGAADVWGGSVLLAASGQSNAILTTAGASFQVTGVKFEIGAAPTPPVARPRAQELVLLQRYYEKSYDLGTALGSPTSAGAFSLFQWAALSAVQPQAGVPFKTSKRCDPAVTIYSANSGAAAKSYDTGTAADVATTAANIGQSGFTLVTAANNPVAGTGAYVAQWTADCRLQ